MKIFDREKSHCCAFAEITGLSENRPVSWDSIVLLATISSWARSIDFWIALYVCGLNVDGWFERGSRGYRVPMEFHSLLLSDREIYEASPSWWTSRWQRSQIVDWILFSLLSVFGHIWVQSTFHVSHNPTWEFRHLDQILNKSISLQLFCGKPKGGNMNPKQINNCLIQPISSYELWQTRFTR